MTTLKYLPELLTNDDIGSLPDVIKIKLDSLFEAKDLTINNLRLQLESVNQNVNQHKFAMEKELHNIKSKLSMAEEFSSNMKRQLRETEAALQESRRQYYDTLQVKEQFEIEANNLKDKCQRQTQDKMDLSDLLERRMNEISQLQLEIRTLTTRLQSAAENKLETSLKAEEVEMKNLVLHHQEIRMQQERELFQKQLDSLNDELSHKIRELATVRRERSSQIFEMQTNLEQKDEELTRMYNECRHSKLLIEKKDKHIESLADRIREIQQQSCRLESDFRNEIASQASLIELHKKSNMELKQRNEKLVSTVEEMQLLLQAAKQAHRDLEASLQATQLKLSEQLKKSAEDILNLQRELKQARESFKTQTQYNLEKEVEKYFPAATTSTKVIKSQMNFTHVYSEYMRLQQEIEEERQEKLQLRIQLQQVTNEAEESGPLLVRKIQEHQRSMLMISELQSQMTTLMSEKEQLLQEKDNLIRINNQFQREVKRHENENAILSIQVRRLLRSVQEARGFSVCYDQDVSSSTDFTTSIDLLTYKDIEDLQTKNFQLIKKINEQADLINDLETRVQTQRDSSTDKQMDNVLLQLEQLRSERRQQAEMVEALIQQRDLYKTMSQGQDFSQRSPGAFASTPRTSKSNLQCQDDLIDYKNQLEKVNNEFANFRENSDKKQDELRRENDKMRQEFSNFQIENSKLMGELTFTKEKVVVYKSNIEQVIKENNTLRDKNIKLSENFKNKEQLITTLQQDILSIKDDNKRLEILNNSLRAERDLARNNEAKLMQEKEILIRDQENQSKFMMTWKSFQSNLEKMESEKMISLRQQIETFEKECQQLKSKFEREAKMHEEVRSQLVRHKQESQDMIDREIEKHKKLQQQLSEIHAKVHSLPTQPVFTQVSCLIDDIEKIRSDFELQKISLANVETEMQVLNEKLRIKTSEVTKLTFELNTTKEMHSKSQSTVLQLKKLARKYKTQYEELNEKLENSQTESQGRASEINISMDEANEEINELRAAKENYEQRLSDSDQKVVNLENKLSKLQSELLEMTQEKENVMAQANEKEDKAKKIAFQAKQRIAALNTEKLNLANEKDEMSKQLNELQRKIMTLEQNLEESTLRLATIKSQHEIKCNKLSKELTDANKQIEELKQQLQQPPQATIAVTTPVQAPVPTVVTPVRHSVHPQQQSSAKSTPTASIKPLAIGVSSVSHVLRTSRTSSSQSRTATIATVQPTTDETHQSVPQATVQPTQTAPALVVVAPTAPLEETALPQLDYFGDVQPESSTSQIVENEPVESILPSLDDASEMNEPEPGPSRGVSQSIKRGRLSEERDSASEAKRICQSKSNVEIFSQVEQDICTESQTFGEVPTDIVLQEQNREEQEPQRLENLNVEAKTSAVVKDDDDDDVIVLESDDSDEPDDQSEEEGEDEEEEYDRDEHEDEEESDYDEQEGEYDEESEKSGEEEDDDVEEEGEDEGEEIQEFVEPGEREDNEDGGERSEEMEGISLDEAQEQIEIQDESRHQVARVPQHELGLDNSGMEASSLRASNTQPFVQVPAPIQRNYGTRLFINQGPSTYDEGDGIVPSTPTLYVPRRGDVFSEVLNSPRVPQGRFVFNATVPEAPGLSQLASEGTLGVDDTRMDLSQFDDNSGRSVPTTPLPMSSSIETVQIVESVENNSSTSENLANSSSNAGQSSNEYETGDAVNPDQLILSGDDNSSSKDQASILKENIASSSTDKDVSVAPEVKASDESTAQTTETAEASGVPAPARSQVARRGRGFRQQKMIERKPIVWKSETNPGQSIGASSEEALQQEPINQQLQAQQQIQATSQQPQTSSQEQPGVNPQQSLGQRRIRLRGGRFSSVTRGPFRGGRSGRGSRGPFHQF